MLKADSPEGGLNQDGSSLYSFVSSQFFPSPILPKKTKPNQRNPTNQQKPKQNQNTLKNSKTEPQTKLWTAFWHKLWHEWDFNTIYEMKFAKTILMVSLLFKILQLCLIVRFAHSLETNYIKWILKHYLLGFFPLLVVLIICLCLTELQSQNSYCRIAATSWSINFKLTNYGYKRFLEKNAPKIFISFICWHSLVN